MCVCVCLHVYGVLVNVFCACGPVGFPDQRDSLVLSGSGSGGTTESLVRVEPKPITTVLSPPRMGKRFPIDLDAALKRSASAEALRSMSGPAAPLGDGKAEHVVTPIRRGGGRDTHRTSSVNSFTPFRRSAPSGASPDPDSGDDGGGGVRSYGSRDTYSILSGSTITSRQKRRSRARSHRDDDAPAGFRCRNPDGGWGGEESDSSGSSWGSGRHHAARTPRRRSASIRRTRRRSSGTRSHRQ